jgi:hypothetical protein
MLTIWQSYGSQVPPPNVVSNLNCSCSGTSSTLTIVQTKGKFRVRHWSKQIQGLFMTNGRNRLSLATTGIQMALSVMLTIDMDVPTSSTPVQSLKESAYGYAFPEYLFWLQREASRFRETVDASEDHRLRIYSCSRDVQDVVQDASPSRKWQDY